jgi:hypothetical protein
LQEGIVLNIDSASQRQLDKNGQEKLKKLKEELTNTIKAKEAHGVKP